MKVDEAIFFGFSLMSKSYRFLKKKSRKIEERSHVKFDDKYIKTFEKEVTQCEEKFPLSCSKISSITTFDEVFLQFFDEPNCAINFEANAKDDEGDELLKIVDEVVNDVESHVKRERVCGSSQNKNDPIKGESSVNEEQRTPTVQPCENVTVHSKIPNCGDRIKGRVQEMVMLMFMRSVL